MELETTHGRLNHKFIHSRSGNIREVLIFANFAREGGEFANVRISRKLLL